MANAFCFCELLERGIGEGFGGDCREGVCGAQAHIRIGIQKGRPNGRQGGASLGSEITERNDGRKSHRGIRMVRISVRAGTTSSGSSFSAPRARKAARSAAGALRQTIRAGTAGLAFVPMEVMAVALQKRASGLPLVRVLIKAGMAAGPIQQSASTAQGPKEAGERGNGRSGAWAEDSEGAFGPFRERDLVLIRVHPAPNGTELACGGNGREEVGSKATDLRRVRIVSDPVHEKWERVGSDVVNGFLGVALRFGVGGVQGLDPMVQ